MWITTTNKQMRSSTLLENPGIGRHNERAGGDGGIPLLLDTGRVWPAAPHHERSAWEHPAALASSARKAKMFSKEFLAQFFTLFGKHNRLCFAHGIEDHSLLVKTIQRIP